jgi:hypothetical protein
MKSYGQRCIRMPPLRGGQSLVHLCLTATIKVPLRGASPIRYWSVGRTGTRRALVGGKARASRSLRHRSMVSRRRTEGSALATRAARCSLRSHSPLLPWDVCTGEVLASCRLSEISTGPAGLASSTHRPIAGVFLRSVRVPGQSPTPRFAPQPGAIMLKEVRYFGRCADILIPLGAGGLNRRLPAAGLAP